MSSSTKTSPLIRSLRRALCAIDFENRHFRAHLGPDFVVSFRGRIQILWESRSGMMQHALAAVGRAGAAWSFMRLPSPRINLHRTVLTGSGCPGAPTKLVRLMGVRESLHSWAPVRAAGQEATGEMALENKKCVPCETGKLQPMSEEKAQSLLPEVSGWELKEIDGVLQLHRSWKAKSFVKGLEIMKRVADVAEAEGGLTENDFIVAAKIGALDLTDLVRKSKALAK